MAHGISFTEISTPLTTPITAEAVIAAVGTAKLPQSTPQIIYNKNEYLEKFGSGSNEYTLDECADVIFNLYNIAPAVFVNVLDLNRHCATLEQVIEGQTVFKLDGDVVIDSIEITTGKKIDPVELVEGEDFTTDSATATTVLKSLTIIDEDKITDGKINLTYRRAASALGGEAIETEITLADLTANTFELPSDTIFESVNITTAGIEEPLVEDEDYTLNTATSTSITKRLVILDDEKIKTGAIKITYRLTESALGGEAVTTEVMLTHLIFQLPSDTILESVTVETVGIDTLKNLGYKAEEVTGGAEVLLPFGAQIEDGKVNVKYRVIDTTLITNDDIINALDKIEAVVGKYNLDISTIIAPGYDVAAALAAEAKKLDAMAISDVEGSDIEQAVENKKISHANLIMCYPKVALSGKEYFLSTHLAALMAIVDADNGDIPYVSPSNKNLSIDSTVANGAEIFITQEKAELLSAAGIVTAIAQGGGYRAWNNYTAVGNDEDFKDRWISVRRMINYIKNYFKRTYFQNLDNPINLRQIDGILQSANLYLASLTAQGILLGGELFFNEADNPATSLMEGKLNFNLQIMPPPPAESINIGIQINPDYLTNLFQ